MVKTTAKTLGVTTLALTLAVSVILLLSAQVSRAATITVDSLDDTTTAGDSDCTLREAIANANSDGDTTGGDCTAGTGADTIGFSVTGVITITQGTLRITDDDTTVNGDVGGVAGEPDIEVRYSSGTIEDGLIEIASSNNHIEGLAVTNSPEIGIYVDGNGQESDSNTLKNNWIGVDLTGAPRGNGTYGVYIWHVSGTGATDNVLQGNTVSSNTLNGIRVNAAPRTQILSNTIGLNPAGTTAIDNLSSGISLSDDTDTTVQGNTISGNGGHGIYMTGTQQITIAGNIVGLNAAGSLAIPNRSTAGIYLRSNVVTATIRGNTVSGNRYNGVFLGPGTTGVMIAGNYIGTDINGTTGIGNGRSTNRDLWQHHRRPRRSRSQHHRPQWARRGVYLGRASRRQHDPEQLYRHRRNRRS
jgi:CSLREA domain-containing protein